MQESRCEESFGKMTKKARKEKIRIFWDRVEKEGSDYLSTLHIRDIRRQLAAVEEHIKYNGKAHKYLPKVTAGINIDLNKVKEHLAYRVILGEYRGKKEV